jgi:hypothetical protein
LKVTAARDERLQIGARADVEAPARFQGVGPVVLARMPGEEGGSAHGPKLQGVPAPVSKGAQVGAHLESRIGLPRRAPQHVVGGKPRNLRRRENDETGAAHAGRGVGFEQEEFRRPAIAQGLGLDAEHIGIVADRRQLEGGDVLRCPRLDAEAGDAREDRVGPVRQHKAVENKKAVLLGGLGRCRAGVGRQLGLIGLGRRLIACLRSGGPSSASTPASRPGSCGRRLSMAGLAPTGAAMRVSTDPIDWASAAGPVRPR